MITADSSIYFRQPQADPLGRLASGFQQGMKIGDLIRRRRLDDKQQAEKTAMKGAYKFANNEDGEFKLDRKATIGALAGISPQRAYETQQQFKRQDFAESDMKMKRQLQEMELGSRALGMVTDQVSYDQFRSKFDTAGAMPRGFDPGFVQNMKMRSLSVKDQMEMRFKNSNLGIRQEELGVRKRETRIKEKALEHRKTDFQKAKLAKLGKSAAAWLEKDRNLYTANIDKTSHAIELIDTALSSGEPLFGPARGKVPDSVRSWTSPNSIIVKEAMHSAIQDTLKPTLGAQFTEKEGERIMKLAVNPELPDKENRRRAFELRKYMKKKIAATDALYQWIDERGTDKGFPFNRFGMRKVVNFNSGENDNNQAVADASNPQASVDDPVETFLTDEIDWAE